jgi:hypothetical protein
MDAAYISAFAALAGSAIGASASFVTTWLTHHAQQRATRLEQERSRRERLYGEFVDEVSRLLADALTHHLECLRISPEAAASAIERVRKAIGDLLPAMAAT